MYKRDDIVILKNAMELRESGVSKDDPLLRYAGRVVRIHRVVRTTGLTMYYNNKLGNIAMVDADIKMLKEASKWQTGL